MSERRNVSDRFSRRSWLGGSAAAAIGALCGGREVFASEDPAVYRVKNGRIRQSVVPWCYAEQLPVEKLIDLAAAMGLASVELCDPSLWPRLKKHGMVCAIASSHGFRIGLNNPKHHAECLAKLRERIDQAGDAGFPSVITFSGMRDGLTDEEGIDNCVRAAKEIISHAEKRKVTLCIEMLNTRDDSHPMKGHPGYHCDNLDFAVDVCRRVGSERMKILFDIYHVQIMHGDVIRRIRQIHEYIAHYHTAGNPGRGELDDTQELRYRPIMNAILETGYEGYVGQEFIPTRDAVRGLSEAVELCDV